jgi:hypothetical protein
MTNRAHRRAVTIDLRHEDFEETARDLSRHAYQQENVWRRRGSDKLNHFMRWCEAITEGMTTVEALGYIRSILPSSLIGDHAYGHWESYRKYRRDRPYVFYDERNRRKAQSFRDSTTFRLLRALAIAPEMHGQLNETIRALKRPGEPRRLLLGIHDVAAFVRAIEIPAEHIDPPSWRKPWPDPFGIERRTTLELIKEAEEKGGRKAALLFCCRSRRFA